MGAMATPSTLPVTGDPQADELLVTDPLALLIGMLLDQQVPMEWAFKGPLTLQERLGGSLDAGAIAAMDPAELEELFKTKPAMHRYPGSMAKRTHDLCQIVVDRYDGEPARIWTEATDAKDLQDRLQELPGYGKEKAKIFMAILGKRLGVKPKGWKAVVAPFSDSTPRSVADVDSPQALLKVREFKKAQKAKGKSKAD